MSLRDAQPPGRCGRNIPSTNCATRATDARYNWLRCARAGSGHSGARLHHGHCRGALSPHRRDDPKNPDWPDRDRILWSAATRRRHLCVARHRRFLPARRHRHPAQARLALPGPSHWLKLQGIEISSGSLGQGLSVRGHGAGRAHRRRKTGGQEPQDLLPDGRRRTAGGQVWEAAWRRSLPSRNIVAVIDATAYRSTAGGRCDASRTAGRSTPLAGRCWRIDATT